MKLKKYVPKIIISAMVLLCITGFIAYRNAGPSSHAQMISLLRKLEKHNDIVTNPFNAKPKLVYIDSLLNLRGNNHNMYALSVKAPLLLKEGQEQKAVDIYENLINRMDFSAVNDMLPDMGIAYMRLGERSNCMLNHTGSSCIFPIKDEGVHRIKTGSTKAIQVYESILKSDPDDLSSRWLLNVAFMTLGTYPKAVPKEFLIPNLDADTGYKVKPFTDMAADLGLDVFGRAGGVIVDDFNNDGYLDIVTSGWDISDPMHYFQNNKDGTFTNVTEQSGLKGITGGLNIQQVDYNNDGNLDIFVLRGAWNTQGFGNQPPSLLRNNGDGTFTDVTIPSGLLYFHPTQAATWADFNNDGYLDVFIGTEDSGGGDAGGTHTCMLYINNGDGTFTNVTDNAHCNLTAFVKGVTSADYNNDGWPDIFISTLNGYKYLLKNKCKSGKAVEFEDVSIAAGLDKNREPTFTTWFFDYDNDGWPDIMVGGYNGKANVPLGYYAAAEGLGRPIPKMGNPFLFHNNHDGTFTEVTNEVGLNKVVFNMGANFGDIDNDGYPDMYFGTGNPDFRSLVPNKLFKNIDGKRFADVTTSSRMGNLQKGHGVAFADFRNVGIQDVFIEMGGAYKGDSYNSSLYVNPGQSNNNWISLKLEGVKANRCAIGSHIKVTFTENGVKRSVYKDVNSGGSFGSSPLRQEIGIGLANRIDDIEIKWAGSQTVQHFKNLAPNQFLHITEGDDKVTAVHLNKLTFKHKAGIPMCMPMTASTDK
ncbi:CRTAC1 family protein [Mucilaginibacter sp. BT774]|uniref:CRTAC1 family protein n=1 Tax=Mucilaginibacter sp. BT774 TaxID=3062276 RepID=UPI002674F38B|nr:CRTAC1 family protein [Mucilaginibacter sp. BT774]MDO3626693.1 CRTAC1 family protein [Mucilaginibacter sp. BT774]